MSLLGEGAAHPNAPLEMTKEASSFLLLPHGREMAEGKRFPGALRERERGRERCGAMRKRERMITGTTREEKEKWAHEIQSMAV